MTKYELVYLEPEALTQGSSRWAASNGQQKMASLGNTDLLGQETLALFCSAKCRREG